MIDARADDRIPMRFGAPADAGPDDALLIEGDSAAPPGVVVARFALGLAGHRMGCACCSQRAAAAAALGALFQARARAEVAWFTAVVAVVADPAAQAAALAGDLVVAARFRLVR